MSEKVKNNMQELEFLSLEMKATLNNLHRLKKKRTILRKEKEVIKETRINTKREGNDSNFRIKKNKKLFNIVIFLDSNHLDIR